MLLFENELKLKELVSLNVFKSKMKDLEADATGCQCVSMPSCSTVSQMVSPFWRVDISFLM